MRTHLLRISLTTMFVVAASLMPGLAPARASGQVVEQTIRVVPDAGGGMQMPFGPAGQRQFKTGSGRIRGRVMANDAAVPIRRAQVRLTGQDVAPKAAMTDAEGRFDFRDLPAGRFTLQASKTGFVTVQYGQTRPFEQGKAIELADKQALDNADIAMPRGGVISGRIVDEFGDAVPDAAVTAMRQTWSNGRRRLVPSPGRIAQTNDLGQFRIFGLPGKRFTVSDGASQTVDLRPDERILRGTGSETDTDRRDGEGRTDGGERRDGGTEGRRGSDLDFPGGTHNLAIGDR
jgi:hypothetical protein